MFVKDVGVMICQRVDSPSDLGCTSSCPTTSRRRKGTLMTMCNPGGRSLITKCCDDVLRAETGNANAGWKQEWLDVEDARSTA